MFDSYDEGKAIEMAHHGPGGYANNWVRFHTIYREDQLATQGGKKVVDSMSPEAVKRYCEQFGATIEDAEIRTVEGDRMVTKVLRVPAAGRKVMRPCTYIRINIPGDKTLEIDREVTEEDQENYAKQYKAFIDGKDQDEASGTLLSSTSVVNQERAEEYKFFKVFTVEQLAGMSDSAIQQLGPNTRKERERAREFLKTAEGFAPVSELRNELERERVEKKLLEERLARAEQALTGIQAFQDAQKTLGARVAPARKAAAVEDETEAEPSEDSQFDAPPPVPAKDTAARKRKSKQSEAA